MTYKFLLTTFLTSLGLLGAFAPIANAQEDPKCYLIDNSRQLIDLTDICNASQKRSPETKTSTSDELNRTHSNAVDPKLLDTGFSVDDSVYILGENALATNSGLIDGSYYIDNEIGLDYTAYIRRFKTPTTSLTRQTLREEIFQSNTINSTSDNLTSILRRGRKLPFIIYRY